jgi:hypothetical protein
MPAEPEVPEEEPEEPEEDLGEIDDPMMKLERFISDNSYDMNED